MYKSVVQYCNKYKEANKYNKIYLNEIFSNFWTILEVDIDLVAIFLFLGVTQPL